ncbi:MAG: TlpA family protein disulfide reductase [Christensenellales bacterium]|jgi:thiol-disulfide isomerase/thioredoxin
MQTNHPPEANQNTPPKKSGTLPVVLIILVVIAGSYLIYTALSGRYGAAGLSTPPAATTPTADAAPSASADGPPASPSPSQPQKQMAPDFTVQDENGDGVTLSDQLGKPVIINFWASWCPPCVGEMPDFQELYDIYGQDVALMMINLTDGARETKETARAFIDGQGYNFPVYYDIDSQASSVYGINSIPQTFFIDAEGYLIAYKQGMVSQEELLTGIEMVGVALKP